MAVKALGARKIHMYTLLRERGLPFQERTKFLMKRLSRKANERLENAFADAKNVAATTGSRKTEVLLAGFFGWENFPGAEPETIAIPADATVEERMSYLDEIRRADSDELFAWLIEMPGVVADEISKAKVAGWDLEDWGIAS